MGRPPGGTRAPPPRTSPALRRRSADLLEAGRRFERLQYNHPGSTVGGATRLARWRCSESRPRAKRLAIEPLDLARATGLPRPIGMAALGLATYRRLVKRCRCCRRRSSRWREPPRVWSSQRPSSSTEQPCAVRGRDWRRGTTSAEALNSRIAPALDRWQRAPGRNSWRQVGVHAEPVFTGIDALTASELRVARMAATGATNRDIAQRLFVTQKTIETHLRHVFEKLNISRREELPHEVATPGNATEPGHD